MFNLILAVLIAISTIVGSTDIVENFNRDINGHRSEVSADTNLPDWISNTVPQGEKIAEGSISTDAKSIYVVDISNGQVLEAQNENQRLPVASLTKLMTAYLILKNQNLDREVIVPSFSVRSDDSLAGIVKGEVFTVRDLLKGLLINSGGDSAQTLAVIDSGSYTAFVAKMNAEAKRLGLDNSHFDNPVGWDSQENYSSAKDISNLARILLNNSFFSETVAQRSAVITAKSGRKINLTNTNLLLNGSDIIGVKTGYTYQAGECLVNLRQKEGHRIMTVVIGSADRFGQTRRLLDWIYTHFIW